MRLVEVPDQLDELKHLPSASEDEDPVPLRTPSEIHGTGAGARPD